MAGIQHILQKKFFVRSVILLCATVVFFFLSTSFAYADRAEDWIHSIGIGVGGFFAGFGGTLFDNAINILVLGMGDLFVNKGLGGVIGDIWTMIRDLFNILFIFSLVYIGLRTILDSDDSRTKKMLGMLIAAALLINFSLYIAKVVVDVSNFTAVQIYKTTTGGLSGEYLIKGEFVTAEASISGAYMQVLNVSSWFSTEAASVGNVFVYSIMAMLFLMFLGFVLAYGALMIAARFIAIIFYLMFSPFMFLGWILPQFQPYATKWWKGFLGYSFFAPVYIFMLYIGLYSLQQIKSGFGEDATFGAAFGGDVQTVDTFAIFLFFAIGTGFLIGATKVAGMMSQGGAAIGMGAMDKLSKRFTTDIANRAAGSGASLAAGGVGGILGGVAAVSERGLGSTMMSRSLRGSRDKLRGAKIGGAMSMNEATEARTKGQIQAASDTAARSAQSAITSGSPSNINASPQQRVAYEKAIQGLKAKDAISMAGSKNGRASLLSAAGDLSEQNMKAINEDENVSVGFKKELNDARQTGTASSLGINATDAVAATATSPAVSAVPRAKAIQNINKADKGQLKDVGLDNLMEGAKYLQDSQVKDLEDHIKDGALTKTQFAVLKEKRKTDLIKSKDTLAGARQILKTRKSSKEIAKLPQEFLEHTNFVDAAIQEGILSVSLLDTIAREGDGINKAMIGSNMRSNPGVNTGPGNPIGDWFHTGLGLQFR